jgi:hypothetical protein
MGTSPLLAPPSRLVVGEPCYRILVVPVTFVRGFDAYGTAR